MSTRQSVRALARIRDGAVTAIEAESVADPPQYDRLRQASSEIALVDAIQRQIATPGRPWLKVVAFACASVIAVVVAHTIRVPAGDIVVQAKATEASIILAKNAELGVSDLALKSVSARSVTVDGGPIEVEPKLGGFTSITEISPAASDTAIVIGQSSEACYWLQPSAGGLRITLAGGTENAPRSRAIGLSQGGRLDFCVLGAARLIIQAPSRLRLATIWQDSTPPAFLPSIIDGRIDFIGTGVSRELSARDRLEISSITKGSLVIVLSHGLELALSGRPAKTTKFQSLDVASEGKELRPSILEALSANSALAPLGAGLAAIWGFLWSLSRLFARS